MYYLMLIKTYQRMQEAEEPAWSNTLSALSLMIKREYETSQGRKGAPGNELSS